MDFEAASRLDPGRIRGGAFARGKLAQPEQGTPAPRLGFRQALVPAGPAKPDRDSGIPASPGPVSGVIHHIAKARKAGLEVAPRGMVSVRQPWSQDHGFRRTRAGAGAVRLSFVDGDRLPRVRSDSVPVKLEGRDLHRVDTGKELRLSEAAVLGSSSGKLALRPRGSCILGGRQWRGSRGSDGAGRVRCRDLRLAPHVQPSRHLTPSRCPLPQLICPLQGMPHEPSEFLRLRMHRVRHHSAR
jgi:hypothetical protein